MFRFCLFLLGRLLHQFVQQFVVLALFRGGLFRCCRFAAALFAGFLDVLLDGRRIHHGEVELLHNSIGSGRVILEHQNVDGVVILFDRDGRIENAVAFGLPRKLRGIFLLDGVNRHRALFPQHGFNAGFAFGLFLVFQDRIQGGGKIFRGRAADLEGKFGTLQAHPYNLFRRIA